MAKTFKRFTNPRWWIVLVGILITSPIWLIHLFNATMVALLSLLSDYSLKVHKYIDFVLSKYIAKPVLSWVEKGGRNE